MTPRRAAALTALLEWLGPWTPDTRRPAHVRVRRVSLGDGLHALEYRHGRSFRGAYLVLPGLHYLGPEDPRLDRFCRMLARAGFWVVAPILRDFAALLVRPRVADDAERWLVHTTEQLPAGERPVVFSISFGSLPALEVAARRPELVDAVITFGGYCSFARVTRFSVEGLVRGAPPERQPAARDPLNSPALFYNLLPHLPVAPRDPRALGAAWVEMVWRTWGRAQLKLPGQRDAIAHELAARLAPADRELFLAGCGLGPGAVEIYEQAFARAGEHFDFAEPGRAIARLERPVAVFHGRDDDVIPWGEGVELQRRLAEWVPSRLYLTGLFAHTAAGRPGAGAVATEVRVLLSMAWAMAHAGELAGILERGEALDQGWYSGLLGALGPRVGPGAAHWMGLGLDGPGQGWNSTTRGSS